MEMFPLKDELYIPNKEELIKAYEEAQIKPLLISDLEFGSAGEYTPEDMKEIFAKLFYENPKTSSSISEETEE